jgi:hypothetical protein
VGLKFYEGAFDSLYRASQIRETEQKCLFLVAEADNPHDPNAVMLHDGKRKLGSVERTEAAYLKSLLVKWAKESGKDDVIVASIGYMGSSEIASMKYNGYCHVDGLYRVNERLARKFADKYRKEK